MFMLKNTSSIKHNQFWLHLIICKVTSQTMSELKIIPVSLIACLNLCYCIFVFNKMCLSFKYICVM